MKHMPSGVPFFWLPNGAFPSYWIRDTFTTVSTGSATVN